MNEQIESPQIPKIEDIVFEKLPVEYRKKRVVSRLLFSSVFIITAIIGFIFLPSELPIYISLSAVVCLFILNIFYPFKSYKYEQFAIRENDIIYKSGIFFRKIVVVPFNRVQHVELKQGPLDRKFGLAKLVFYTAGGSMSDLSIKGLYKDNAENIKTFVISKIGTLVED